MIEMQQSVWKQSGWKHTESFHANYGVFLNVFEAFRVQLSALEH